MNAIVLKLLEKEPEKRYQTAYGLLHDLKKFVAGEKQFKLGQLDERKRVSYRVRLIGRENELADLKHLLQNALAGKSSFCVVIGDPGVGKTRLIDELSLEAIEKDVLFLTGKCQQQASKIPYLPFKEILRKYVEWFEHLPVTLRSTYRDRFSKDFSNVWRYIVSLVPEAKRILAEDVTVGILENEKEQQRFLNICARLLCNLHEKGQILVIEDFHWADEGSIELLRELVLQMQNTNTLLIVTMRPSGMNKIQGILTELEHRKAPTKVSKLSSLDFPKFETMVKEVLGSGHEKLAKLLFEKTGGNPLALLTTLKELIEEKAVYFYKGSWVENWDKIKKIRDIEESASNGILSRIKNIDSKKQMILKVCSALGRSFTLETVSNIVSTPPEDVLEVFDYAVGEQFLYKSQQTGEFVFVHDKIREAFYNMLKQNERKVIHRKIASFLEKRYPEDVFEIANHYMLSDDTSKGIEYALKAARLAASNYANKEAIRYFEHAIQKMRKDFAEYPKALEELGESLRVIGMYKDAIKWLTEAIAYAETNISKARLLYKIGEVHFQMGENRKAINFLESALKHLGIKPFSSRTRLLLSILMHGFLHAVFLCFPFLFRPKRGDEKTRLLTDIYGRLAYCYYFMDKTRCIAYSLKTLNSMVKLGEKAYLAKTFTIFSAVPASEGKFWLARVYLNHSRKILNEINDELLEGFWYSYKCYLEYSMDKLKEAALSGEKAVKILSRLGEMWELAFAYTYLTLALLSLGELRKIGSYIDSFVNLTEQVRDLRTLSWAYHSRAYYRISALAWDEKAIAEAKKSFELGQQNSDVVFLPTACDGLSFALRYNGLYKEAADFGERGINLFEKAKIRYWWSSRLYARTAEAYFEKILRSGVDKSILQKTKVLSEKMMHWARRHKVYYPIALRTVATQLWFENKKKKAVKLFIKSAKISREAGALWDVAQAFYQMGKLMCRSLRFKRVGKKSLARALLLFRKMGARPFVEDIKRMLGLSHSTDEFTPRTRLKTERELTTVMETAVYISSILDLEELLEKIVEKSMELTGAQRGVLFLYPEEGGELEVRVAKNVPTDEIYSEKFTESFKIIKRVERTGQSVLMENESVLCLPIMYKGETLGVLYFDNKTLRGLFTERERRILEVISRQAAVSIENALLYKRAITDALTGLYNRGFFENYLIEQIKQTERYGGGLSLLMIDIDDFKKINDRFGHQVGDIVLKKLAKTFKNALRSSDFIARYGGEEFVVVLPRTPLLKAAKVALKLKERVSNDFFVIESGDAKKRLRITISIGVAEWKKGYRKSTLIEKADAALYQAKAKGKNRVELADY